MWSGWGSREAICGLAETSSKPSPGLDTVETSELNVPCVVGAALTITGLSAAKAMKTRVGVRMLDERNGRVGGG